MQRKRLLLMWLIGVLPCLLLIALSYPLYAQSAGTNIGSWTDPSGSGLTIKFYTPNTYESCTSTADRIYTEGIPANWSLTGSVEVYWAIPTSSGGTTFEKIRSYPIAQNGNLDLTITYPPASTWPDLSSVGNPLREVHVSPSILVRDQNRREVSWLGNDLTGAPSILGPGQVWDVICLLPPTPTPTRTPVGATPTNTPVGPTPTNTPSSGTAALGDRVWNDTNGNGVQDIGEPGVGGVTIELLATCTGSTVLATRTTNVNGTYLFNNLAAGQYRVRFTLPGGFSAFSPKDAIVDDDYDSDVSAAGVTDCITLNNGEQNYRVDAGLLSGTPTPTPTNTAIAPLGSLGDRVWRDDNGNGIQDANEPGIPGVTVQLKDCNNNIIRTTTTDSNGIYSFTGLAAGCYRIGVVPNGFTISPANQGSDDTRDSDVDPATATTGNINLGQGENNPTIDAGLIPQQPNLGSLGDRLWRDDNSNGIQDAGEPGVAGITVQLKDCSNNVLRSSTTDGNGLYGFTGLNAGCYVVRFVNINSAIFAFTAPDQGGDDTLDSDVTQLDSVTPGIINGQTGPITFGQGENNPTIDAGLIPAQVRYTLGDRVWYDQNQNGRQDANEPGYNGVTVQLFNNGTCAGTAVATTTTAVGPTGFGNGYYQFPNLSAGPYCVQFSNIPAGWSVSPANQGDDAGDSDADPTTARITNINLTANDPNEDLGIFVPGTLGDNVQCVSTGQPLPNITVNLFKDFNSDGQPDGPVFRTTQTNASGAYQFTGLEVALAGDSNNTTRYIVTVDSTDPDLGACNTPVPPTTYNPPLTSNNPNDPNNDFKFQQSCRLILGDRVWSDANLNGIQDTGESGVDGVVLDLLDSSGNPVLDSNGNPIKTTTANGGAYQFIVPCGAYQIEMELPNGKALTLVTAGNNRAVDSNANPAVAPTTPLPTGGQDLSIDFGLVNFKDLCPPSGTTGLPTPLGTLYWGVDASGNVSVRYDQSRNINDNSYGINRVGWPRDHKFGDLVGSDKAQFKFTDAAGNVVLDILVDTISAKTGTPSGYASLGVTGGEGRVNVGQAAWVLAADTAIAKNLNNLGFCVGGNCASGGTNLLVDSPPTVNSSSYELRPGSPYVGWNFTNSYEVTISRQAFGASGFGSVSVGEIHNSPPKVGSNAVIPGLCEGGPGACSIAAGAITFSDKKIEWPLTNNGGGKVTLTGVTLTWPQANGKLMKVKLDGDVIWDKKADWSPAGVTLTSADFTTDVKKKSIDPGKSRKFTLEFEKSAVTDLTQYLGTLTFDSGCTLDFPPGSGSTCTGLIGDFVWNDQNGNGLQDTGEPGIAGVPLTLKLNGVVKGTTSTDVDGLYQFARLCAGNYTVEVTTPLGYTPTTPCSTNQTVENDNNCSPAPVTLPADNSANDSIDFGFKASGPGGGTLMCPTTPIPGYSGPVGTLFVTIEANGDVSVRYDQSLSPGLNDNSYGTNIVQWPRSHTFSSLTGSDGAQFIFYNAAGAAVLNFELDYLSAKSGTPSGYASLGPDGGDGSMIAGSRSNIVSWDTSMAQNLNTTGYCTAGNCTVNGVNLLVNSPPTVSSSSYTLPAGSPFGAWNFTNSYSVRVARAAFGASGFGRVALGNIHNSPPKVGSNVVVPIPCVSGTSITLLGDGPVRVYLPLITQR